MAAKHNPAPWEYENVEDRHDRSAHGVVKDANGKILFDTLNSDVAEIHEEPDEGHVYRFDATAERNLTLAAAAPELFTELRRTVLCLAITDQMAGAVDRMYEALAKAEGKTPDAVRAEIAAEVAARKALKGGAA